MQPPAPFENSPDTAPRPLSPGQRPLILVGASVRSAAQSADRAGISVIGIDFFGDTDTLAACRQHFRLGVLEDLPSLLDSIPTGDLLPVGGLAGRQYVTEFLRSKHRWLGPPDELQRLLCEPNRLSAFAQSVGLKSPPIDTDADASLTPSSPPSTSYRDAVSPSPTPNRLPPVRWLRKERHSAGGLGIEWAHSMRSRPLLNPPPSEGIAHHGSRSASPRDASASIVQRWIEGFPYGISYFAQEGSACLLGICRSSFRRIGKRPFVYAGSCGPVARRRDGTPLSVVTDQVQRFADALARRGLRGLFNVDVVVDRTGTAWLLEVNARWTASSELIEQAWIAGEVLGENDSLLAKAYGITADGRGAGSAWITPPSQLRYGDSSRPGAAYKRIVFASRACEFHHDTLQSVLANASLPGVTVRACDVPPDRTRIGPGEPILTCFVARDHNHHPIMDRERVGSALRRLFRAIRHSLPRGQADPLNDNRGTLGAPIST